MDDSIARAISCAGNGWLHYSVRYLHQRDVNTNEDAVAYTVQETKKHSLKIFHSGAWWALAFLALSLLMLCALLAGLTLGVCGLDMTLLQMRSITGTPREKKQALVVVRMKRRGTWMLCSLIICSVACSEYFPFVIQSLCQTNNEWVAVIISTLLLAIFAELIPQWLIPQRAITWGYYCWPLIWGCMWLTALVSYPLAWFLDHIRNIKRENVTLFTKDQLVSIIQYHERSEKRGGELSRDTVRIVLGALYNEGRKVGGEIGRYPKSGSASEKDVEKADILSSQGLIVKWSAVKSVNINEPVDMAFVQKVKGWCYTRIPVIGERQTENNADGASQVHWRGNTIYGFLHVKNLIGLDFQSRSGSSTTLVKDLPLYPLPIIKDDMCILELLNLFQLGMSRIAVVIPAARSLKSSDSSAILSNTPLWTATMRRNPRIVSQMKQGRKSSAWTTDYLAAAQGNVENSASKPQRFHGINSPKPIGIITFQDIIDTLLQKTSRNEEHFFDLEKSPSEVKKGSGYYHASAERQIYPKTTGLSHTLHTDQAPHQSTFRNRKPSRPHTGIGLDGVNETSFESPQYDPNMSKLRHGQTESSYTINSQGGFHGANCSSFSDTVLDAAGEHELTSTHASAEANDSMIKTVGVPCDRSFIIPSTDSESSSATPRLSQLQMPIPLSRRTITKDENKVAEISSEREELVMPKLSIEVSPKSVMIASPYDIALDTRLNPGRQLPEETLSINSWLDDAIAFDEVQPSHLHDCQGINTAAMKLGPAFSVCTADADYDGFPLELLEPNKENHIPNFLSRTMPGVTMTLASKEESEAPYRQNSFHDDRALLPSQLRALNDNVVKGGTRSSSLWF